MDSINYIDRITFDPKIMVGKPVIKGTRLTVPYILGLLVSGATFDEILDEYDGLEHEDILACIWFGKETLENTVFQPLETKFA